MFSKKSSRFLSLSESWAILSQELWEEDFIDELAALFKKEGVSAILEYGCGSGHILHGLAKRGFFGVGVDKSKKMISLAKENYSHPCARYVRSDWLGADFSFQHFDCVMCRGNSLPYVLGWEKDIKLFDAKKARKRIEKSIDFMVSNTGGLLYIDTTSQKEIDNRGGHIEISSGKVKLQGLIIHDWKNRTRYTFGGGNYGEFAFYGGSAGYLMRAEEIEEMLRARGITDIWRPALKNEKMYDVVCARTG